MIDVDAILDAVRSEREELDVGHAIAALPGQGRDAVENPCRMAVEAELRRLCNALGFSHVEQCFSPRGVGRLAALCFPDAGRESLRICCMAMVLALLFDDVLDRRTRTPDDAQVLGNAVKAALAGARDSSTEKHPLVRLAFEIHRALQASGASDTMTRRFQSAFYGFVDMAVKSYGRWLVNSTSASLQDYLQERYHDIGVAPMFALMELAHRQELDEHRFRHPEFVALRTTSIFFMTFVNDIFSYHKEVIQTGNLTNAIAVVQMQYQLSFAKAASAVVLMARRCCAEFETRARRLLDDDNIPDSEKRYITGMGAWIAGAMRWTLESERYRHYDSPFPELRRLEAPQRTGPQVQLGQHGQSRRNQSASSERGNRADSSGNSQEGSKVVSLSATVTKRRTASI